MPGRLWSNLRTRLSSLRILFALSVEFDWEIDHICNYCFPECRFDRNNLYGAARGIYKSRRREEGKVCLLKRALYELKQAAKSWNDKIHNYLISQDFCRSNYNPCVYIRMEGKNYVVIGLHVDDFIFSNFKQETKKLKKKFSEWFKIRVPGAVSECLKMIRDRKLHTLKLDQENYAKDMKRFDMEDCKTCMHAIASWFKIGKTNWQQ